MPELNETAKGVYVIAATPFTDAGAIDVASIDRMIDSYIACGVQGITILGMMGEASKLSEEEGKLVVKRMLARADGKVPVVVGVSNSGIEPLAHFSRFSMDQGAAGVMIAPMSGLRTDEQIVNYFAKVCETMGSDIPIVLQDYPQSTNVFFSASTVERLIDVHPQIVMFKHEDCPGLQKLTRLRESGDGKAHRRVSILVGNGGLYFPQELARGADGAMTGFAYPDVLVEVWKLFGAGNAAAAEDLYDLYLPLLRHEQQPGFGLGVRKEILRRRGFITSSHVRAPGPKLTRTDLKELDWLMARLDDKLKGRELTAKVA
jgi:4-hydroxy-tetrahydrodipicolinate synthase